MWWGAHGALMVGLTVWVVWRDTYRLVEDTTLFVVMAFAWASWGIVWWVTS